MDDRLAMFNVEVYLVGRTVLLGVNTVDKRRGTRDHVTGHLGQLDEVVVDLLEVRDVALEPVGTVGAVGPVVLTTDSHVLKVEDVKSRKIPPKEARISTIEWLSAAIRRVCQQKAVFFRRGRRG